MSCKEYLKDNQLCMEKSKARGRFLVSGKAISAGTTILECNPLSFAVTNDKQKTVCQSCLKDYPKLSVCSKCNYASYCCRQCQLNDWKTHKKECNWMRRLVEVKQPLNSLILITRMVYQVCTHEAVHSNENGIITGEYTDILDHCDNLNVTDAETIENYKKVADIIHDAISDETWYDETLCRSSMILSIIGRLYNNRFSVSNLQNDEIGVALYPLLYLINHRCMPNSSFVFDGMTVKLRAIADIKKGEEISISYVDSTKPSYIRNNILRMGYSFQCDCPLCKDLLRDKKLCSFNCPCGGVQYPTIEDGYSRPVLWICEKCGREGYYADEYRLIEDERCYNLLIWLQTDEGYSYKKARQLYAEYKEKCTKDNFLYNRLLQYLITYFISLSRTDECEEISQTLLRFSKEYGCEYSRALIQEYISCGKLDVGLGKNMSALKFYQNALEIAKVTDGVESQLYRVIDNLMGDVRRNMPKCLKRQ